MHHLKIITIFLLINFSGRLISQNTYENKLQEGLNRIALANSENEYEQASNFFVELCKTETNKWLPYYYSGFCKTILALKYNKTQADLLCNEADIYITKCDSLSPNNTEVYVLKSMVLSARINVNAKSRAIKYNKLIIKANEMAIKLNPSNPRAYLQKAQSVYYTPEAFGGGKKKALPLFEIALEKFKTFKPENKTMPKWGKDIALEMIEKCKS